jgi:hypothetical protein
MEQLFQAVLGEDFRISGTALFFYLCSLVPVGAVVLYLCCRIISNDPGEENLGGKAFLATCFHRLMFGVAFWVVLLTGIYQQFPLGDTALLLLMHIGLAALVIRWWISDALGRVVVVSVLFAVLDSVALASALLGSAALFA